jgi:hypothetical protein
MINREPTDAVMLNHVPSKVEALFQHLTGLILQTLKQVQGDATRKLIGKSPIGFAQLSPQCRDNFLNSIRTEYTIVNLCKSVESVSSVSHPFAYSYIIRNS